MSYYNDEPEPLSISHFISDFTLGFSDGLTVPFALTAGLSSLGETNTVIYAGLAELCAGSISMGIGGFLSARDALQESSSSPPSLLSPFSLVSSSTASDDGRDEEKGLMVPIRRDSGDSHYSLEGVEGDRIIRAYLGPLGLHSDDLDSIVAKIATRGHTHSTARRIQNHLDSPGAPNPPLLTPMKSSLAIALGYLTGGLIPLVPYFFATTVAVGMRWSVFFCVLALFSYGSGKSYMLGGKKDTSKAVWEGLHMLIMGGVAAGMAVACVHVVEGMQNSAV